jgi:hypothetical protein
MKMRLSMLGCAAAALTAGCGEASEKAFNEEFDKNFKSSCVSSATQAGAPADAAEKACDCSLTKINEKYATSEKLTMSGEDAQPIMAECIKQMTQP